MQVDGFDQRLRAVAAVHVHLPPPHSLYSHVWRELLVDACSDDPQFRILPVSISLLPFVDYELKIRKWMRFARRTRCLFNRGSKFED